MPERFPAIPSWSRRPHKAIVQRANPDTGGWDELTRDIPCYDWPETERTLTDMGWAQVETGRQRMDCDWAEIVKADGEPFYLRTGDRIILDPATWGESDPVRVYQIVRVRNPGQKNYVASIVMESATVHGPI
jgi:hypothetical protein